MNPTKFSRNVDGSSVGLVHWQWGSRRTLAVTETASRSVDPLDGHIVYVETDVPCHLRFGGAGVAADASDPVLKPGAVYAMPRAHGETHLSVLSKVAGTTGTVEFWQADTFHEA